MKQIVEVEKPSTMNFIGGIARFISRTPEVELFPFGTPRPRLANNGESVLEPKPVCKFVNFSYKTRDDAIAAAIIKDPDFGGRYGYMVDAQCLPKELRDYFNASSITDKQQIAMALCKGKTATEIIEAMDPEDVARIKARQIKAGHQPAVEECPVPGCTATINGDFTKEEAQKSMASHLKVSHPEWVATQSRVQTGTRSSSAT